MNDLQTLIEWVNNKYIDSVFLDDVVHELKSKEAAEINNCGLEAQLEYILDAHRGCKNH
ncbi:hypothetical protein MTAT_19270 [Moorella thermoacetica]|uniref:Uncharacterized protein n=1 Tax=Neomoorella thermoacetica TaxID=1525 RepID=A0AAC9MVC7_NEOTH|nr:hypothetical protein [Moorella thermoacetica]AOQ24584.1 hypothetical protein Maut_02154 [Moorella thermoacetica]TYL12685.1 hypothetical protein MTAT_19270 [Moorella thermoacetica]